MSITNFSPLMALLVLLVAFVIPPAATSHDQPSTGFRTTLKHVDHLLADKLTKTELLQRAIKRGSQRVQRLKSRLMGGPAVSIHTPVDDAGGEYLMNFSIGTPKPSPLTAIMDTGSSLVWTQCQPCQSCFNQSTPIFDPKNSLSYSRLRCSTNLQCKAHPSECSSNGYCNYNNTYGDGSYTRGVVATDAFTFYGNVKVPEIVFGCGVLNKGDFISSSGVVGLGPVGPSLVSQMNEPRFSYCLPTFGSGGTGVLTMGCRATNPWGVRVRTTPLIINPLRNNYYYLSLQGITIGQKPLSVNSSTFARAKDGSGGMIIDSGTTITYLVESAFDQVNKELTRQLGLRKTDGADYDGLELCFNITSVDVKRINFPVFIFHFQNGVDLKLRHQNYFHTYKKGRVGCLMMGSIDYFSILGSFQQQNTLVVHDLAKGTLSFLPNYAECGKM